ncbi:MAG: dTDP-4-dehydrorhamnose 3,5-epimerase [Rubrivivax sp.]|nr:dTDP-4-dehydrorhamnose 3,5-epimerase [Rubrivivax sp.]
MNVLRTAIDGMLILEPAVFDDARGFFMESYNARDFDKAIGAEVRFVQDNHSRSAYGVLRGMHYQLPPHAQGKLVRVVQGEVFNVSVDLRRSSPSFRRWVGIALGEGRPHRVLWLPPGLAHGFLVTSASADLLYKTTAYYAPQAERCLRWDDPAVGIAWPALAGAPRLAERDATAPRLTDCPLFD